MHTVISSAPVSVWSLCSATMRRCANSWQRSNPFVTDTIWLGKLNRGVTSKGMTQTDAARLEAAKKTVRQGQSDENILALVSALKNNPKVRWKDSIKEVMP